MTVTVRPETDPDTIGAVSSTSGTASTCTEPTSETLPASSVARNWTVTAPVPGTVTGPEYANHAPDSPRRYSIEATPEPPSSEAVTVTVRPETDPDTTGAVTSAGTSSSPAIAPASATALPSIWTCVASERASNALAASSAGSRGAQLAAVYRTLSRPSACATSASSSSVSTLMVTSHHNSSSPLAWVISTDVEPASPVARSTSMRPSVSTRGVPTTAATESSSECAKNPSSASNGATVTARTAVESRSTTRGDAEHVSLYPP